MKWTEGMVHVAVRRFLREEDWLLLAGQYPGGSDDELPPLNIVDPLVARDQSPDPRRHSLGKLVPDVVALKANTLLIVEAKVGFSEADRLKLVELLENRRQDLLSALRRFAAVRGISELAEPERLNIVPALAMAAELPRGAKVDRFAILQAHSLDTVSMDLPGQEAHHACQ